MKVIRALRPDCKLRPIKMMINVQPSLQPVCEMAC